MSRRPTIGVAIMLVALALVTGTVALAEEVAASTAGVEGAALDKPEDLVTLSGLSYPGFRPAVQLEVDAGLLSMLRPMLEALLHSPAGAPGPLGGLGEALEKMGPEAAQTMAEFLAEIRGVVLAIQTPRDGEVNVPKVATYYLQRALSVGWKPVLRVNQDPKQSIAVFQLPTPAASGGTAEPPQGFVLTVVSPQQVIAAGVLARFDLAKLLPLLPMLGNM